MIGCEIEVERMEDAVLMSLNPDSDDYVIELSLEAFDALARALEYVTTQGVGYVGRYCFDVDDDDE